MSVWGLPVPVLKQWKGSKRRQVSTGGAVVSKNRLISVTMRPQWEGLLFYGAKTADSATCSECEYAPAPFPPHLQTVPTVLAVLYRTITLYVIKFKFCFILRFLIKLSIYNLQQIPSAGIYALKQQCWYCFLNTLILGWKL